MLCVYKVLSKPFTNFVLLIINIFHIPVSRERQNIFVTAKVQEPHVMTCRMSQDLNSGNNASDVQVSSWNNVSKPYASMWKQQQKVGTPGLVGWPQDQRNLLTPCTGLQSNTRYKCWLIEEGDGGDNNYVRGEDIDGDGAHGDNGLMPPTPEVISSWLCRIVWYWGTFIGFQDLRELYKEAIDTWWILVVALPVPYLSLLKNHMCICDIYLAANQLSSSDIFHREVLDCYLTSIII